jgi:hypothetical protein
MRIKTRAQAIEAGDTRYYTGEPCSRGHIAERFTSGANCAECLRERGAALRERIRAGKVARAKEILAGGGA